MEYADTSAVHRWAILPPNVPQDPSHWIGKRTPNGDTIVSMDHAKAVVAQMRSFLSLPFDVNNPLDPVPLDIDDPIIGNEDAEDGNVLVADVANPVPWEDRHRTDVASACTEDTIIRAMGCR